MIRLRMLPLFTLLPRTLAGSRASVWAAGVALLICLVVAPVSGQVIKPNLGRESVRYDRLFSVGATYQSNDDLGLQLRYGIVRDAKKVEVIQYNVHSLQHPEEARTVNTSLPGASPYKFGKLNFALVNSFQYGRQHVIAERNERKQVRVNVNYALGPNITLLKPIYLELQNRQDRTPQTKIERYDPEKHNDQQQNFLGTASFDEGLGEMSAEFGLALRSSMSFYWGEYDYKFYGLEVGSQLLLYPEKLEIMATERNRQAFLNLFVCLKLGNQW